MRVRTERCPGFWNWVGSVEMEGPVKMNPRENLLPISSTPGSTTGAIKEPAPDRKPKPMTRRGLMVALSYMVCAGLNSPPFSPPES